MNRQLSRLDFLFATRIRNEPFGQFRTFTVGNHPAHHIAAEDVEDHVEIEVCPLRGTEQFRDIPAPELVWGQWPAVQASCKPGARVGRGAHAPRPRFRESGTWCESSNDTGLRRAA